MSDAKKGRLIAVIYFLQNFSKEFETRLDYGSDTPDDTIYKSQIPVWMDMSSASFFQISRRSRFPVSRSTFNFSPDEPSVSKLIFFVFSWRISERQSALLLERQLLNLHQEFINETFSECQIQPKVGMLPIQFREPVHGNSDASFTQFMTPGVVTT